jgi:hypothetical protein
MARRVWLVTGPVVVLAAAVALVAVHLAKPTPSAQQMPPPIATRAPVQRLTGFGATMSAWNSTHVADGHSNIGANYGPDPALPKDDGHTADKYWGVRPSDGLVSTYYVTFLPTSLEGAKAIMAREFPSDTSVLWTARGDTCVQIEYASPTLHAATGADGVGDVLVYLSDVGPGPEQPRPTSFDLAGVSARSLAEPDAVLNCQPSF